MNVLAALVSFGAAAFVVAKVREPKFPRAMITYQIVKAEDWATPDPGKPTPPDEFVIVGSDLPRGLYRAKLKAKKLPDGFYEITEVLWQKPPALDIIPGLDHGWLFVPKRRADGTIETDASGKEIWNESVVPS